MDEMLREKIRTYGTIFVIMAVFMLSILVFLQFKEKSMTAMKLKIVYSEISQAITFSMRDNGNPGEWGLKKDFKNANILDEKLFKFFKTEKRCIYSQEGCTTTKNYKSVILNNTDVNIKDIPSVMLRNGASVAIETLSDCKVENENCANVFVDTNGPDEPNALGKDLFVFIIRNSAQSPLITYGESYPIEELKKSPTYGCNRSSKLALYCAALIKKEDWKIKSDYPW